MFKYPLKPSPMLTTVFVAGVNGFSCLTPGSTGYLFQPAPCAFGKFKGEMVYCDQSTEGDGIVGIRDQVLSPLSRSLITLDTSLFIASKRLLSSLPLLSFLFVGKKLRRRCLLARSLRAT
jgi:hypothetical protein